MLTVTVHTRRCALDPCRERPAVIRELELGFCIAVTAGTCSKRKRLATPRVKTGYFADGVLGVAVAAESRLTLFAFGFAVHALRVLADVAILMAWQAIYRFDLWCVGEFTRIETHMTCNTTEVPMHRIAEGKSIHM